MTNSVKSSINPESFIVVPLLLHIERSQVRWLKRTKGVLGMSHQKKLERYFPTSLGTMAAEGKVSFA